MRWSRTGLVLTDQAPDQSGGYGVDVVRAAGAGGQLVETEPVTEVFGQRHFFVRDPEGTWLGIIQLVEPDPAWLVANMPAS
jgi:catechol 2,3-dioxygenase-like lactoylglutathione lyase family enzyme